MLKLNFLPDSDRPDLLPLIQEGIKEFQGIWMEEGERIVTSIKKFSGLKFQETQINAVVYVSRFLIERSFPLSLKADNIKEIKIGSLIHELSHRIFSGNRIQFKIRNNADRSIEFHKIMNLFLYDVWEDLYGEDFAKYIVEYECTGRKTGFSKAWDWALSYTKEERAAKLKKIVENSL